MTSFEAKVLLTGGETATIATYLFDTLKEKMPTDGVTQYSDWFQEINIILLTKRIEAINAEDTLGYLYTTVYNKIKDEYKKNEIVVISNLGIMNFKNPDRVMQIQSYHPGHTVNEIKEKTGFDLLVAPDVAETPVPGPEIINLINNIDPDGVRWAEFC